MQRIVTQEGQETTALEPIGDELRIVCGWCHHPTPEARCASCGRDPALPWTQRGDVPPTVPVAAVGRPTLSEADIRPRYAEAVDALRAAGRNATVEAIAEQLDRSPRTVREWRQRFGL